MTKERQKASLKSMYYNRFLMVRYCLAVFFFADFFWGVLSWGTLAGCLGIGLVVLGIMPVWEMGKMYGVTEPARNWTRMYFRLQLVISLAVCVLVWTSPMQSIYPFFNETALTKTIGFLLPLCGVLMSWLCVRRISKIDQGCDRQLQRIQFFETKYNLHI